MNEESKSEYNPIENPIIITCMAADVIPIDRLLEFQGNLKKLSEVNRQKLFRSIIQEGFTAPFFVWDDQGEYKIIDGHQRLKTLLWMRVKGWDIPLLPVVYIEAEDKTAAKKKLLKITSQYGEFVIDEINEWIGGLDADIAESIRLVDKAIELSVKPEDTIGDDDLPEEIDPITKLGDLWELGNHRLLCGDSTDNGIVKRLLSNNKIDMIFTDAPYGVSYSDKNKFLNTIDNGNRIQKEIINDNSLIDKIKDLWGKTFKLWSIYLNDYSSYYICSPQGRDLFLMIMMMNENNFPLRHCIIWVKNNHVLGRCDYDYKHEPILYGWNKKHKFYGKGDQKFSTWNYNKPLKNDLHPTMKPIELIVNAILNSSIENQNIADPFLGSGSTLIACEKTNRICYGVELDPYYCDVIVNRYKAWCIANNKKPVIKLNGEAWNGK